MSIGMNMKKARETKGMTQKELADRTCVSRSAIAQFELGSRCPNLVIAQDIAKALGVTVEYLIRGEDNDKMF